jgi:GcrA cell cycle regulator
MPAWTEQLIETMLKLQRAGLKDWQIAQRIDRSVKSVAHKLAAVKKARAAGRDDPPLNQWSEDRVELLRKLSGEGLSASQIAARLGITRNAALGKLHRLGLSAPRAPKRSGISKPTRVRPPTLAKPVIEMRRLAEKMRAVDPFPAAILPTVPPSETGVPGVSLIDLAPNGCRFPVNSSASKDDPHLFCNAQQQPGSAYCPACHARCYNGVSPRRPSFPMRFAA